MAESALSNVANEDLAVAPGKRRILLELAIPYGLILLVIWTPRPLQKLLWWVAAAAIVAIFWLSFDRIEQLGLRTVGLFRALWVTGAALVIAAVAILTAVLLHTLRFPPGGITGFFKTYWAYALWACVQQLLLQGFFLPRCLGLTKTTTSAALLAAVLFSLAHLPNPLLTPVTLIWGFAACLLFVQYRNLYPLAMAHAIVGIAIAITIPGPVDHNMRVGLGYLAYHHPARPSQPQLVKPSLPQPSPLPQP